MKRLLILLLLIEGLAPACKKYLDVVPPNTATLESAFNNSTAALNFFYSLYSYIPRLDNVGSAPELETTDEVCIPNWNNHTAKGYIRGQLNSSSPYWNYWGTTGGNPGAGMFDGIRQCYTFLDNIDKTPNIGSDDLQRMKGEATFLIGYFHFVLLREYGPIVTVPGATDLDATGAAYYPSRQPYDSCVRFITNLLDKAAAMLPATVTSTELGRATSVVCKSIKARMLLYAASPLFNGNAEFYSNFKNHDGKLLMNLTYDANKWKLAADACLDAIQTAQGAGVQLYTSSIATSDPFQKAVNNYRYSMVDPWNSELIWGYTDPQGNPIDIFHLATPRIQGKTYNGECPTLKIVETYYTQNGLPIDVDPSYDYANRYQLSGTTIKLHQNREPRFYASIGYDRGNYAVNNTNILLKMMSGEANGWSSSQSDFSPGGYLQQKGIHPASVLTSSAQTPVRYPWPIIRLGELYLDYAEALNEYAGVAEQSTVIQYLDPLRIRSGIPGVLASWALVGKSSFTQDEMRTLIRQERTIELAFEGHRFWDVRRWKMGDGTFNVPVYGMNIKGATPADFYQPTLVEPRIFNTPSYYLMPISVADLGINTNLVQNPGW
ncbi:MAG TPA: RagB/SusD family nutrient uptake outer membrane protein [Puia sp.]|nr:RagB/SusD family nutrient uptake outer membrane protein [Puia sp.]